MWLPVVALAGLLCTAALGQVAPRPAAEPPAGGAGETMGVAAPVVEGIRIPTKNLLQVMRDGGLLMYPIGICSVVLLVFVFERAISLRRGRVIPRPFVRRFLEQLRDGHLDRDKALELCEKNRSSVAAIFGAAVKKWSRPSVEVEQAILDEGERVTNDLRRYLRVFNGVSTLGPLLGLLGTVCGMISAFNAIANVDALGRPELLASGISQALLTTAAGLCVAIPALLAQLYFAGRVDRLIIDLDALGQEVVGLISSDSRSRDAASDSSKRRQRGKVA
jgi:biopolymer transport protein ExbB